MKKEVFCVYSVPIKKENILHNDPTPHPIRPKEKNFKKGAGLLSKYIQSKEKKIKIGDSEISCQWTFNWRWMLPNNSCALPGNRCNLTED